MTATSSPSGSTSDMAEVRLNARREKSVRHRHPWLYSGAIERVTGAPKPGDLVDVIDSRGLTPYAVAKLSDIDPGMVARFVSGERDLRLASVDRIAAALGLRLVEVGRAKGRAARVPAKSVAERTRRVVHLSLADSWRPRARRREWPRMQAFATERTGTDHSLGQ